MHHHRHLTSLCSQASDHGARCQANASTTHPAQFGGWSSWPAALKVWNLSFACSRRDHCPAWAPWRSGSEFRTQKDPQVARCSRASTFSVLRSRDASVWPLLSPSSLWHTASQLLTSLYTCDSQQGLFQTSLYLVTYLTGSSLQGIAPQ